MERHAMGAVWRSAGREGIELRVFDKLNLKQQREILVINAPPSFEPELLALSGVTILRDPVHGDIELTADGRAQATRCRDVDDQST